MEYTGHYRIDVKWTLIFVFGLLLFGYGCYMAFDDAAYHEMVETGRKRLLDYLPRPALQVVMAACVAAIGVFIPVHLHAVFTSKLAFAIRADGIQVWPLLLRKPAVMAWEDMRNAYRMQDTLFFIGRGKGGEGQVTITLIGYSRKKVLAAIAGFRPDIAEALR